MKTGDVVLDASDKRTDAKAIEDTIHTTKFKMLSIEGPKPVE